jgi:ferrous iron transport protein B
LFAVFTGLVLKNTLFHGEASPFVMEMPPYHLPNLKSVLLRTWDRLKQFMFKAGKVIVAVVLVLSFLNSIGTDGSFGHEDSDKSVLASIGKGLTPVVAPMGISEDNWPATVGLFTGIFAKESVVGTLNALYGQMGKEEAGKEEQAFDFWGGISGAFATIPAKLVEALGSFTNPLGLDIGDVSSHEAAAAEQEVSTGIFGAMVSRFDGQAGAFAYLLAILLYMPCVAAVAAIFREVGARWTLFSIAWTTALAYGASVAFYQASTFAQHPTNSTIWLAVIFGLFTFAIFFMRWFGRVEASPTPVLAE